MYCTKWKCRTLYTPNLRSFYRFCLGHSYMQYAWMDPHDKNYNYKDGYQYMCIVEQIGLTEADGEVRSTSTTTVANGIAFRAIRRHLIQSKSIQIYRIWHLTHPSCISFIQHEGGQVQGLIAEVKKKTFWIKQTVFERCFSIKTSGIQSPSVINIHFSADSAGVRGAMLYASVCTRLSFIGAGASISTITVNSRLCWCWQTFTELLVE